MSSLLKFLRGGLDALEQTEKSPMDGLLDMGRSMSSVSGVFVAFSVFFGVIWEFGKMLATWVSTEGAVTLNAMLSVFSWSNVITSSVMMSALVFVSVLFSSKGGNKDIRNPYLKIFLAVLGMIFLLGFIQIQNKGSVCIKDLPSSPGLVGHMHCPHSEKDENGKTILRKGYELAYAGPDRSILLWMGEKNAPGYLGSVISVPTSNVVLHIWNTDAPGCWSGLRNFAIYLGMRFPSCELSSGSAVRTD